MIRLYLDWSVISQLKKKESKELLAFIKTHKRNLLIPYSPAHINDLKKSFSPENELFFKDIEMLDFLTDGHLLKWDEENKRTQPLIGFPSNYFNSINHSDDDQLIDFNEIIEEFDKYGKEYGLGSLGTQIKTILNSISAGFDSTSENSQILGKIFPHLNEGSTMWDVIQYGLPSLISFGSDRSRYLEIRKIANEKGFKIDPNSTNWDEKEVLKRIDVFLKKETNGMDFYDFISSIIKNQNVEFNKYDFYKHAYFILDMIGYKQDKFKKPTDNLLNLTNDSEHSFYAAYCDYFIVKDKSLSAKTKVLYNKLKINTQVVSPDELIGEVDKVLYKNQKLDDSFVNEILSFLKEYLYVESFEYEDWAGDIYKLPLLYFNYFTHLIHTKEPRLNGIVITFKRVFANYSNFTFYVEDERLINSVNEFFGSQKDDEFSKKVKSFVYDGKNEEFVWQSPDGKFRAMLNRDNETGRPLITYFFQYK